MSGVGDRNMIRKLCMQQGCTELVRSGYCEKHTPVRTYREDDRLSAYKRGYTSKWQQYREIYLRRNPLCVECEKWGYLMPATVVDHINPHKGDMRKFWDSNNHQALCSQCHNRKTAKEDGGYGNKIQKVKDKFV